MSTPTIRKMLEARLATWALTQSPVIPIAWQNVPFDPPKSRYLSAFILPASTISLDLLGTHRLYRGIWQINISMPIGTGPGAAEALAVLLAALFPMNLRLTDGGVSVTMTSPLSLGPALQDSDRFVLPVSASYRTDTI